LDAVGALAALAVIIITGFIGQLIFRKTGIPDVIMLIALGMLIGPHVLSIFDESMMANLGNFQEYLMALALVFILFDGGLRLKFQTVMQKMGIALFQTITAFMLCLTAVTIVGIIILGMTPLEALLLGGIIGGTSSVVVLAIVPKMNIREETKTLLSLESALTDVVVIVFIVALVQIILKQSGGALGVGWIIVSAFAISAVIGLCVGILWLELLKMFEKIPFAYMLTLAVLFLVFAACEASPLEGSGAVGALFFGLALGNKKHFEKVFKKIKLDFKLDAEIKHLNSEITFVLRSFFFVYLGLIFSMNTATFWFFTACAIICATIVVARYFSAKLTAFVADLDTTDEKGLFAMLPRGLAAAVLATYPMQQGVTFATKQDNLFIQDTGEFIQNSVLVVIVVTTILATFLTFLSEKHATKEQNQKLKSPEKKINRDAVNSIYEEITELEER